MLKLRQPPPFHQQFKMKKPFNNVIITKCLIATIALIPLVRPTPITVPIPVGIKSAAIDLGPPNGLPCIHGNIHQHQGLPLNTFQKQTDGRILNKQPTIFETSVTSNNGLINAENHAQTLNNFHQKLPDVGVPCFSQQNSNGQNYNQEQTTLLFRPPLPNSNIPSFDQGFPQPPTQLAAPAFYLGKLGVGKVIPSQVLSGQIQNNDGISQVAGIIPQSSGLRVHQHYASSIKPGLPSVINGFSKTPAPAPALPPLSANTGFNAGLQSGFGNANDAFNPSLQPPYRPFTNIPLQSPSLAAVHQTAGGSVNNFQHGFNTQSMASSSNSHTFIPNPSDVPVGIAVSGSSLHSSPATGISTHFTSSSNAFQNSVGSIGNVLSNQLGHVIHEAVGSSSLDPSAEKHIYVHVPPEDLEESHRETVNFLPQSKPRKHYKIIFIKAPSVAQKASQTQLTSANLIPQTEEKTIIYVLVKKPEEPSLEEIQQIQQKQTVKHNKPEVYFIKYKTRQQEDTINHIGDDDNNNNNGVVGSAVGIDIRSGGSESVSSVASSSTSSASPSSPLDIASSSSVSSSPSTHYLPSSASLNTGDDGYVVPHNHKLNGVPLE